MNRQTITEMMREEAERVSQVADRVRVNEIHRILTSDGTYDSSNATEARSSTEARNAIDFNQEHATDFNQENATESNQENATESNQENATESRNETTAIEFTEPEPLNATIIELENDSEDEVPYEMIEAVADAIVETIRSSIEREDAANERENNTERESERDVPNERENNTEREAERDVPNERENNTVRESEQRDATNQVAAEREDDREAEREDEREYELDEDSNGSDMELDETSDSDDSNITTESDSSFNIRIREALDRTLEELRQSVPPSERENGIITTDSMRRDFSRRLQRRIRAVHRDFYDEVDVFDFENRADAIHEEFHQELNYRVSEALRVAQDVRQSIENERNERREPMHFRYIPGEDSSSVSDQVSRPIYLNPAARKQSMRLDELLMFHERLDLPFNYRWPFIIEIEYEKTRSSASCKKVIELNKYTRAENPISNIISIVRASQKHSRLIIIVIPHASGNYTNIVINDFIQLNAPGNDRAFYDICLKTLQFFIYWVMEHGLHHLPDVIDISQNPPQAKAFKRRIYNCTVPRKYFNRVVTDDIVISDQRIYLLNIIVKENHQPPVLASSKKMITLNESDLFVVEDPVMETLKTKQIENFWTAVDLKLENDDLTIVPAVFLKSLRIVMNLFVKMDKVVNDYLSNLKIEVSESAKRFHHIQMSIEDVHHEVYTQIIKNIGVKDVLHEQSILEEALQFGLNIELSDEAVYHLAVLEGFHFSFVFALFLIMRTYGYMNEACKANEFILKDEYLHCAGWLNILKRKNQTNASKLQFIVNESAIIQNCIIEKLPLATRDKLIMKKLIRRFENSFYDMAKDFAGIDIPHRHIIDEDELAPYIASVSIPTRTKFMDNTASGNEYTNSTVAQDFSFLDN